MEREQWTAKVARRSIAEPPGRPVATPPSLISYLLQITI